MGEAKKRRLQVVDALARGEEHAIELGDESRQRLTELHCLAVGARSAADAAASVAQQAGARFADALATLRAAHGIPAAAKVDLVLDKDPARLVVKPMPAEDQAG